MVRPSNPKLMARVLEAVTHLGEGKGSLTRDVLNFVKHNSAALPRNLTMQVRRALKHAVNAGLLSCKSGRYKMQLELNPVSCHRHSEQTDNYKKMETSNESKDHRPIPSMDAARKTQDRRRPSRKKRSTRKVRKRSGTRTKRKATRRRTAGMEKRARKMGNRPRRRTTNEDGKAEDWATRKRRMMSKPKFDDDVADEEEEGEEEEAEEREQEEELDDEEEIPQVRKNQRIKSVNEDRFSDISGDSVVIGRHRSRRSKHLANERSPSRRGSGDGKGHRGTSRRSTSRRRRSQPRQPRENRRISQPEENAEDREGIMDEERDNEIMEMDEDRADVGRISTPPENQENE